MMIQDKCRELLKYLWNDAFLSSTGHNQEELSYRTRFFRLSNFFPKKCSKDFQLIEWFPASSDTNLIENFSSLKVMCMRIENNVQAKKMSEIKKKNRCKSKH